ncbi:MAG: PAS domain S-box protein [bacterium]
MNDWHTSGRRTSISGTWSWLVLVAFLVLVGLACSPDVDDNGFVVIKPVLDPDLLPWKFSILNRWPGLADDAQPTTAQFVPVDDCGDGTLSMYDVVDSWRRADSMSSLILYADARHTRALAHYNIPTARFTDHHHSDFDNDGVCDIAVLYTTDDTARLAVYNYSEGPSFYLPLATGLDRDRSDNWDGAGQVLADYDINGDGVAELLVGIDVGYDLYPRLLLCVDIAAAEIMWQVEVASVLNKANFFITSLVPGEPPVIVAAAGSKGNATVANGMDDRHSYLLIVDLDGNLLYQRQAGGIFSRADPIPVDVDQDGEVEIILPKSIVVDSTSKIGPTENTWLMVLRPSGDMVDSLDLGWGGRLSEFKTIDFRGDEDPEMAACFSDGRIILFDQQLRVINQAIMPAAAGIWKVCDFLGRGDRQLLVTTSDGRIWLLGPDFSVLAQFTPDKSPHRPGSHYRCGVGDGGASEITLATDRGRMHYLMAFARTPWTTVFSRQPWLPFGAAAVPLLVIIAVILFGWFRLRRQREVIGRQRDRIQETLTQLRRTQGQLVAAEEFQKAQQDLAASEQRFRELAELLPQMVFETDAEGRMLYANRNGLERFGYSAADIESGVLSRDLIAPEDRDLLKKNLELALRETNAPGREYIAICKDGTRFPILVYSNPIIEDGRAVGIRGIAVDLTELKRSQEALQQSEEKYRALVESAGEAIFTIDRQGHLIFLNRVAARRLGGDPGDFEGRPMKDLFPPDVSDRQQAAIDRVFETGAGLISDSVSHFQGADRYYRTSLQPLRDHTGEVISVLGVARDITESVEAAQALQESERRWSELVQNLPDFVTSIAYDGTVLDINRTLPQYDREQVIGSNALDFIPEKHRPFVKASFEKAIRTGEMQTHEAPGPGPDGPDSAWWETRIVPSPHTKTLIAIHKNVTERKRAEEALMASEQFNRAVIENSPLGISVRNRHGKLLSVNQAWQDIWQVSDETLREYLAADPDEMKFDHRDSYLGKWQSEVARVYHEGGLLHIPELRLANHRSGELRWISQTFYAINDQSGMVDRVVIITNDITERKLAENTLRKNEEQFRGILASLHETIIFLYDRDGTYLQAWMGPDLEERYDASIGDVVGRNVHDILPPELAAHALETIRHIFDTGEPVRDEYEISFPTGDFWHDISLSPVRDDSGQVVTVVGFVRDVTDRKRHQEALHRAVEERYQQARSIAGGVAHEIYNALFPATSCLAKLAQRLAADPLDDPARNRQLLQLAQASVRRAIEATDLVKIYSRLESERSDEPVPLHQLAEEVLAANADRIEDIEAEIEIFVPTDLVWRMARGHAFSILNNIVRNGLDALADVDRPRQLKITGLARNGGTQLTVSDNGPGIPAENQSRIFLAFFSTKPGTGTGLGLAMVKRIVELYGGQIEVHSQVDKGTDLVIFLMAGADGQTA